MKTFRFKLPDEDIVCTIPESWEELTVKQAIKLNLKTFSGNPLDAIALLSGVDTEKIKGLQIMPKHIKAMDTVMSFLASAPLDLLEAKHKKTVTLKGKEIKIPADLQKETFGQYALFHDFAQREDALSMIMALYTQPLIDGELGELERIEELAKEFESLPFMEIFPVINFFFQKMRTYKTYGIPVLIPFL